VCLTDLKALDLLLLLLLLLFDQGKTPGGLKIRKENYEICLEVNPTLAGRHKRNHHAAKPN